MLETEDLKRVIRRLELLQEKKIVDCSYDIDLWKRIVAEIEDAPTQAVQLAVVKSIVLATMTEGGVMEYGNSNKTGS